MKVVFLEVDGARVGHIQWSHTILTAFKKSIYGKFVLITKQASNS